MSGAKIPKHFGYGSYNTRIRRFDSNLNDAYSRCADTGWFQLTLPESESWHGDTDADGHFVGVPVTCAHVWKDYQGLTEVYRYCTICDAKDKDERK